MVHPGFPIELPPIVFSGQEVTINPPLEVQISIVADGFREKSYKIPVSIVNEAKI